MAKLSGQFCEVLYAGYKISGYSRQFDLGMEWIEEDATAFLDGEINSQPGLPVLDASVTAFLDAVANRSWDALKAPATHTGAALMVLFGQGATPTTGDPAFAALAEQFRVTVGANPKDKLVVTANFKPEAGAAFRPDLGTALANVTITVTTTGAGVDGGAANAAGGTGYLMVFTPTSSDTYVVKIQDAPPPGSVWTDYITFAANGLSRASERIKDATNLDQHRRYVATRTGAAANPFGFVVIIALN
jgi:hypothetical protein